VVNATLRRQGIKVVRGQESQKLGGGKAHHRKRHHAFHRQLATMMKAGVPLLQAFDIVARATATPGCSKLLMTVKTDVESVFEPEAARSKSTRSISTPLFCNLVGAGEQAGNPRQRCSIVWRSYKEKDSRDQEQDQVGAVLSDGASSASPSSSRPLIMIFVIPAFKQVFACFGADLPGPTLVVMAISDFFVELVF
jgi:type IV pilus assembly protein PilC